MAKLNNVERRTVRPTISRTGGNSGPNSYTYKVSVPNSWCKKMNVTLEDRDFIMEFDEANEVITLRRNRK